MFLCASFTYLLVLPLSAQRRAFNREQRYYKKKVSPKKDSCSSKKVIAKWKPTIQRDPGGNPLVRHRKKQLGVAKERKKVGRPPKHPVAKLKNSVHSSKHQQNRKCGQCEACLLKTDCGRCDFCCDKPKFGGQNLKHQNCRWRQCLQFAMACVAGRCSCLSLYGCAFMLILSSPPSSTNIKDVAWLRNCELY
uniref:CXXC-type domain-containing protein n=1 Tax=Micrurus corallinus TaxID=54390 RepID=A0A2D4GIS6_MICCO